MLLRIYLNIHRHVKARPTPEMNSIIKLISFVNICQSFEIGSKDKRRMRSTTLLRLEINK